MRYPVSAHDASSECMPSADVETSFAVSALTALLVTDLEGFTRLLVRLGDLEARHLMRVHNSAVRSCLGVHRGVEIAHLGDGVLAAFHSVRGAIACASAIQHAMADISREHPGCPMRARIGVHAGEPLADDGRLFGLCVNTAVRICDAAKPGTVLVSDVVRQLAAGQQLRFVDCGLRELDGLPDRVVLHELLLDDAERCGQVPSAASIALAS